MIFASLAESRPTSLVRPLLAAALAVVTAVGPISPAFAQEPAQNPTTQPANPTPSSNPTPQAPPIPVSLGSSKHNYTNGPKAFPNFIKPYFATNVEHENLTNSPRIEQLIHDGKLQLTLQDAVELALENSLDIVIQRYTPWYADTDILRTKAGGSGRGSSSAEAYAGASGNLPFFNTDPVISQTIAIDDRSTPVNNPFLSGTGGATNFLVGLKGHTSVFNTTYSQSFLSGTTFNVAWDNTRSSSTSTANFFNPSVQSTLSVGFTQQLLNGCCWGVNHRNLIIAKNNRKIADLAFTQQAITTVTNTITAYWELVYSREAVKVQEQAVAVSDKLFNDNKKQLEIGTLAPLEVTRAEAQLASDRQNLIVAQTTQLQQQQVLKNAIAKDPLAVNIVNVEIVPTELPSTPEAVEAPTFEEAFKEALTKRPDLLEQVYNLKNADIDVASTKNALRPALTLSGSYSSVGLAGNSPIPGTPVISSSGVPIVDANGTPILVGGVPIFEPSVTTPVTGTNHAGFTTAQSQVFQSKFPDFQVSLNLQLPLRNRTAQADNIRSQLTQRQLEAQVQQLKNNALLDVRNTYIALEQDRARVEAAIKARELQQQTFDAEQKKYQLGASTVYNVILTQRDYVSAQGVELRALADLVEAKANYERAVGRTLEVNRVTIADAKSGQVDRETLIPGTLNGHVVGTENLFTPIGEK
jgi:outer membrane protein TolC